MIEGEPGLENGGGKTPDAGTRRDRAMTPSAYVRHQFEEVVAEKVTQEQLDELRAQRSESAHGPHNRLQKWLARMRSKLKRPRY